VLPDIRRDRDRGQSGSRRRRSGGAAMCCRCDGGIALREVGGCWGRRPSPAPRGRSPPHAWVPGGITARLGHV